MMLGDMRAALRSEDIPLLSSVNMGLFTSVESKRFYVSPFIPTEHFELEEEF